MAEKNINQLTEDTGPTSDDYIPSWDTGAGAAKKVSLLNLQGFLRTNYAFWELLGSSTLGGAADVLNVTSFTPRRFLMVLIYTIASGNIQHKLTFNNDTAANYAIRESANGGADTASGSATSISLLGANLTAPVFYVLEITNLQAQEKLVLSQRISSVAGAANAPTRAEQVAKWANTTAQISRIDITNVGTGDYAAGSQIVILGHD